MKKASENPHTKLANAAFRQAAQKVIKRARVRHAGDYLGRRRS